MRRVGDAAECSIAEEVPPNARLAPDRKIRVRRGLAEPNEFPRVPRITAFAGILEKTPVFFKALVEVSRTRRGLPRKQAGQKQQSEGGDCVAHPAIVARTIVYARAARAAFTRAEVNGTVRSRTPVASKIALASAPPIGGIDASPAPITGSFGRSISEISIAGI